MRRADRTWRVLAGVCEVTHRSKPVV